MAAGATYTPIASYTVTTAQTTITFSSFSGYTDLRIIANMKDANLYGLIRFNSDSSASYSRTGMYGTGASASSFRTTSATSAYWGTTAVSGSEYLINTYDLQSYSSSSVYKAMLATQAEQSSGFYALTYLWAKTNPMTSIDFISATGTATIAVGSTISLYGILAA